MKTQIFETTQPRFDVSFDTQSWDGTLSMPSQVQGALYSEEWQKHPT